MECAHISCLGLIIDKNMSTLSTYQIYGKLMSSFSYSYSGVELSHVSATKIWAKAKGEQVYGLKHLIRFFVSLDYGEAFSPSRRGIFIATFMENYRKDHYDLYNTVINGLMIKPAVTNLYELKKKVSIHPIIIVKMLYYFFVRMKNERLGFLEKIQWAAEYVYLANNIQELNKKDFSGVKKYLCMCHVLSLENLMTQYFKNKGVETFSLQEGIYLVYKKNIVLGSIAYELFATDHLLCWGQYTKDEYVEYGIAPSRIEVSGYPKCHKLITFKKGNAYKKCLVMLAGPIFGDVNAKLLEMLERMKDELDITLKSHPANYAAIEVYAKENSFDIVPQKRTVGECFESGVYDFSIAVNTTAYYESWMAGVPSLRYYDERFDNFYGFEDFFSDENQLSVMIKGYRTIPKTEEEVQKMLEYAIGFGIDNYNKVLNNE